MAGGSGYWQVVSGKMRLSTGEVDDWRSVSSQDPWLAKITGSMGMWPCPSGSLRNSSRLSSELDILGDDDLQHNLPERRAVRSKY